MVKRLLTALTIVLGIFFIAAQLQSVSAQTRKQNAGYVHLIQQIIIVKNGNTTTLGSRTKQMPIATPTIYIKPSTSPTSTLKTVVKTTPQTPTQKTAVTESATTPTKTEKSSEPTTTAPAAPSNDPISFIMAEINKYRAERGLSAVQTSSETCNFASTRAAEIASDFSHAGFQKRIDSKTLPYASWSGITENLAMDSDYTRVVNMWANSPSHAANMRADTPFVCVRQSGSYYAYEGMKP